VSESEPRGNRGDQKLVSRIAGGFGLKIASTGSGFLFNLILARALGAAGSGQFAIAQTATMLGSTLGRLGLDNTVLRFTATHDSDAERNQINPVLRTALVICSVLSILVAGLMYAFAPLIAPYMSENPAKVQPKDLAHYADMCRLATFAILPFSLSTLIGQALIGLKRTNEGIIVQLLIMPLSGSVLAVVLIPKFGLQGAVWSYSVSALLALLFGAWKWRQRVRGGNRGLYNTRALMLSCLPLFQVTVVQFILKGSPVWIIARLATVRDVGIYSMAVRTAFLLTFVLSAVSASVSPMFTQMYNDGDMAGLEKLARKCAQAVSAFAAIPFLIFLLIPNVVMGVFGKSFVGGGATLAVIAVGQYVNVATGSVQQLLIMTGHEKLIGRLFLALVLPFFALMYWLTPLYGALGAGITTAIINIVQNLVCAYMVKQKLGIWTLPSLREIAEVPTIAYRQIRRKLIGRKPGEAGA
jgi:O-antigen/teichoic acid export membrane protein